MLAHVKAESIHGAIPICLMGALLSVGDTMHSALVLK